MVDHRRSVIESIEKLGFKPNVMEFSGSRADLDVIDSSLQMVRDSAAYIGIISRLYGQTPYCPRRNPKRLSLCELEFDEALRLGRPVLLFIMKDDHPVTEASVELSAAKRKKLKAFRERAKLMNSDSEVQRVYEEFSSKEEFATVAAIGVSRLVKQLSPAKCEAGQRKEELPADAPDNTLPKPPRLAALPRYLGSHPFVGRRAELDNLSSWCRPADPNPMLLFEAMGGTGKSILTWEWITNHAVGEREDWGGRFWYSFYEKGAVMSDFCRQALAYMTSRPATDLTDMRPSVLEEKLIAQMESTAWLLILDGLERVLVAYHRLDAPQLADEDADLVQDQVRNRDPRDAIRPEDDALLRRLAAAAPSKILVTSRLTPKALLNVSGTPVPGVRRELLAGLRPLDAELMIRQCGVDGDSQNIQSYLQTNCDCHPLVIGVLAGLINDYIPQPGSFDQWLLDANYGASLDLADLSLVQRRNHILMRAIQALSVTGLQLLRTMALLQSGADYATLLALNPHAPPEPVKVEEPIRPQQWPFWKDLGKEDKTKYLELYQKDLVQHQSYLAKAEIWQNSPKLASAASKLSETVKDLEKRGLLLYDTAGKRYDLHPVVRAVVAGKMGGRETQKLGRKVVDHFTSRSKRAWEDARDVEELSTGMQIVRVLFRMKKFKEAYSIYSDELFSGLFFNIGADAENLSLLRPFFPNGWDAEPVDVGQDDKSNLLNSAALVLSRYDSLQSAKLSQRSLRLDLKHNHANAVRVALGNTGEAYLDLGLCGTAFQYYEQALKVAEGIGAGEEIFIALLDLFRLWSRCGHADHAEEMWCRLDPMGREWPRSYYRPGDAEIFRAHDEFWRGAISLSKLDEVESVAKNGNNWFGVYQIAALRGEYYFGEGAYDRSAKHLTKAICMQREASHRDVRCEAFLALARAHSGKGTDQLRAPILELAEDLSAGGPSSARPVAELWRLVGNEKLAHQHALRAHDWAMGEGEPFVSRYELQSSRRLLKELGLELPPVRQMEPLKGRPLQWKGEIAKVVAAARKARTREASGSASSRLKRVN
jgi:tetratricopeptide (TPR) repeat protein